MVQASCQDASWMPPSGCIFGTPIQEEPRGRPKTCWRDYISQLAWARLIGPPGGVGGSGLGEEHLPAQAIASMTPTQISGRK